MDELHVVVNCHGGCQDFKWATPFMAFSITYYLKLHNAIIIYYRSHFLPTKMRSVIWTL